MYGPIVKAWDGKRPGDTVTTVVGIVAGMTGGIVAGDRTGGGEKGYLGQERESMEDKSGAIDLLIALQSILSNACSQVSSMSMTCLST